jgi:hypothetical protein
MKLSLPPELVEKLVGSQLFPFVKFSFPVICLMKLSLPPELVEKLVGSQLFPFVKFSFPVMRLMPYYAETGRSHPLI